MIELKEHNVRPYEELCNKLESCQRVAYVSATGTGKTYVAGKYIEAHQLIKRTLILVPSNVIRRSWRKLFPSVAIMSYQALLKRKPEIDQYSLIVCDEMHHLGAEKWGENFIQFISGFQGKILGMTATPIRFLDDCRNMIDELFNGNVVNGLNLPEAINKGILPSFDYITALYDLPSRRPKRTGHGGAMTERLHKQLDVMENELTVQKILKKHMKPGKHRVAVFVPSIEQCVTYEEVIAESYPNEIKVIAHSKMTKAEVEEAFQQFETADTTSFLFTIDLLNEGAHIRGVDTVIMFRKTESPNIFLQQLGRALTADSMAERVTVFDFVANHSNIRAKIDGAGTIIDWIQDGVTESQRQIIKTDYAKEEQEVLDKLNLLLMGVWQENEIELIRRYYRREGGKEKLVEMLPDRSWSSICYEAHKLGLSENHSFLSEEILKDIEKTVPQKGLKAITEKYPAVPETTLRFAAQRLGVYTPAPKPKPWTEKEDDIIRKNYTETAKSLAEMLPGRTACQITQRRLKLGLGKKYPVFTERDRQIILAHPEMSTAGMQKKYFPNWSSGYVAKWRKKLNCFPDQPEPFWNEEKRKLFTEAYKSGGMDAVKKIPEFSSFSRNRIYHTARRWGIRTEQRTEESCNHYTSEEITLLRKWMYDGLSHSNEEIERLFPEHTVGSVRCKIRKMRRKERNKAQNA